MMAWIKCTDRMPPDMEPVMVTVHYKDWDKPMDKDGIVLPIAYHSDKAGWRVPGNEGNETQPMWYKLIVTHWMHMPKPAEDGKEKM